jgi:hypothetical protein
MDKGIIKPVKEGFFTDSMEVGISVDSVKVTSHLLLQIHLNIQWREHQKCLQDKFEWDNSTWDIINWKGIKSGFLSLGPLKQMKTSKSMHGWLNNSHQKLKTFPDATESHKCPSCLP